MTDPHNPASGQGWTPSSAAGSNLPPPAPGPGPANPTIGPGAPQGMAPTTPSGANPYANPAPHGGNTPPTAPSYPTAAAPPPPPDGMSKGLIAIIGVAVLLIALGVGGYFFFIRGSQEPVKVETASNAGTTQAPKSSGTTPGTSADSSTRGTERDGDGSTSEDGFGGTTLSVPTPSIDIPPPTTTTTTASSGNGGGSSGGGSGGGGGGNSGGGGGGGNSGGGGGGNGGGGNPTPTNPPPTTPSTTQPPKKAVINSVSTSQVFCFPDDTAKDGTVTWSASNAEEVAVSVQNVNDAFQNPFASGLPASGSVTVTVSCVDSTQQTATVTARDAAGNKVTKKQPFTIVRPQT